MRTVFVDIDTQIDFLFPAGALYVPGAEELLPAFVQLNQYAAARGIPIVSTTDAHAEDDPEFKDWPAHCVAGTVGQLKPAATLAPNQTIVRKRHIDVFQDSDLAAIIERLQPERCVVYGVVTEYCVRSAALGLLRFGQVEVVTDAIETLDPAKSREVLDEIAAAGGRPTTVAATIAQ
jgi:nicotinamidase/pyrazinamidase